MAAAAIIDLGVVLRLVGTAFEAITGIARAHLGEADPESSDAWLRLEGVTQIGLPRQRSSDEPHHADIEISFSAVVSEAKRSRWAIGTACGKVTEAFEGRSLYDPDSTNPVHMVDCREVTAVATSVRLDEQNIRVAEITVKGTVTRFSGTSIADHLT